MLAQLDIFMYKAYSESMAYSVSGTLFRYYSRAIYAYSEPYLGRFRHIYNFGLFRHVMFHAYSGRFTKLHFDYTYRGIFAHIWVCFSRFRHIQDPCITGPNSVNQHLLLKSGSFFKSLFRSIWNIFSFLFQKLTFSILFFRIVFQ